MRLLLVRYHDNMQIAVPLASPALCCSTGQCSTSYPAVSYKYPQPVCRDASTLVAQRPCNIRISSRHVRARRALTMVRAAVQPSQDANDPAVVSRELASEMASQPGIRIIWSNDDEEEDEDEDWGDILEELGNPWQMEPGKLDPVEDLGLQPLLPPTPATATSTASWTALELQSFQQLLSNTPGLVVLDVREQEERESRPQALVQPTQHQPLKHIDAAYAMRLSGAPGVVVLGTGDHRGLQAATRLAKVYGLTNVHLLDVPLAPPL